MYLIRPFLAWLLAVVVTAVLGSVTQTQYNLAALSALGADIGVSERIRTTAADLAGFAPAWAVIVALGLLLGLTAAGLLARRWPRRRTLLMTLAGAVAVLVALMLMRVALPMTLIAATRAFSAVVLMSMAGGLGGWIFARCTATRHRQ